MAVRVISITGGPGSGKSTLSQALTTEFKRRGRKVTILDEASTGGRSPIDLALAEAGRTDIVLAEGFLATRMPRIEVHRRAAGRELLYSADRPDAEDWVAILTDDTQLRTSCRLLRFTDTMWMQQLAALAWDRAKVLGG